MLMLTVRQARQFLLFKQGLLGGYRFRGKQGVLDFVRQAGCIQFDPIDVCGRNAELVCQSRVKGFTRAMLDELLYRDRLLFDYVDKNTAILLTEDWPCLERYRQAARRREAEYPAMAALKEQVYAFLAENETICSSDLELEGDFLWRSAIHWSNGRNLSRSILEQMYSAGELMIHHKRGTRKYYGRTEQLLSSSIRNADHPFPKEMDYLKWRVLRRIGGVGLIWNRPSDAWLHIWELDSAKRKEIFRTLMEEGAIQEVGIAGEKETFFFRTEDLPLLEKVLQSPRWSPRCELLAPLDSLLWDRKLIKELFGFDYKWEIYTPEAERRYGYYVLPLLYGERFVGRVEAVADRKYRRLLVKNIWMEPSIRRSNALDSAVTGCLGRFAQFHDCEDYEIQAWHWADVIEEKA